MTSQLQTTVRIKELLSRSSFGLSRLSPASTSYHVRPCHFLSSSLLKTFSGLLSKHKLASNMQDTFHLRRYLGHKWQLVNDNALWSVWNKDMMNIWNARCFKSLRGKFKQSSDENSCRFRGNKMKKWMNNEKGTNEIKQNTQKRKNKKEWKKTNNQKKELRDWKFKIKPKHD